MWGPGFVGGRRVENGLQCFGGSDRLQATVVDTDPGPKPAARSGRLRGKGNLVGKTLPGIFAAYHDQGPPPEVHWPQQSWLIVVRRVGLRRCIRLWQETVGVFGGLKAAVRMLQIPLDIIGVAAGGSWCYTLCKGVR